jgi:hypothetical protein
MWNIAQVNIGRMNAPTIDDPIMSEFVAQLDNINKLAESSKGFVWRLKEDGGNATNIKYSDDARIIVNMSVWETIDDLSYFTYKTLHRDVLAQRAKWFGKMSNHFQALWYVPRNSFPSIEDARFRLAYLEKNGPTPMAFNFAKRFPSEAYVEMLNRQTTSL